SRGDRRAAGDRAGDVEIAAASCAHGVASASGINAERETRNREGAPMSDTWTNRLSEYLDGDLPAGERTVLEAHLPTCAECSETLAQLRRVVARAQALDDRAPTADLWPAIARHVGVVSLDARRARRRLSFTVPQLAAAAVALALLSGGSAWLLERRPAEGPPSQSTTTATPMLTNAGTYEANARYAAAVAN